MNPTSMILKMMDHTWTTPLGQLLQIPVQIFRREYKIDFIVFRTTNVIQLIFGILGRPWLIPTEAKGDWGKGTLTLGKGKDKYQYLCYLCFQPNTREGLKMRALNLLLMVTRLTQMIPQLSPFITLVNNKEHTMQ